eukprot:TRINITY_DN3101_c0_g2_i2.p1 TRINITY_DN3101_c0_g2~~TRINITY_DN3101_c0_g2_i2.p1  ORF type:complete len:613 (+),score=114.78 TRINITY_DN3101_c0_g2_i2:217-2055(+)
MTNNKNFENVGQKFEQINSENNLFKKRRLSNLEQSPTKESSENNNQQNKKSKTISFKGKKVPQQINQPLSDITKNQNQKQLPKEKIQIQQQQQQQKQISDVQVGGKKKPKFKTPKPIKTTKQQQNVSTDLNQQQFQTPVSFTKNIWNSGGKSNSNSNSKKSGSGKSTISKSDGRNRLDFQQKNSKLSKKQKQQQQNTNYEQQLQQQNQNQQFSNNNSTVQKNDQNNDQIIQNSNIQINQNIEQKQISALNALNTSISYGGGISAPLNFEQIKLRLQEVGGLNVELNWITNHCRWIIWKLSKIEKNLGTIVLTLDNLVLELFKRHDKEFTQKKVPIVKKILEGDSEDQFPIVLCVANIQQGGSEFEGVALDLTDGWYVLRAYVDEQLVEKIKLGKLEVGQKLRFVGYNVRSGDQGKEIDVFGQRQKRWLNVSINSCHPVDENCRMGALPCQGTYISLNDVYLNGGAVVRTMVAVQRVYPMLIWDGENGCHTNAATYHNSSVQRIERLQQQIMDTVQAEEIQIYKEYRKENSVEGYYARYILEEEEEIEDLAVQQQLRLFVEERQQAMQFQIRKLMEQQQQRCSKPFLKILVAPVEHRTLMRDTAAYLFRVLPN